TLAVRLGDARTRALFVGLLLAPLALAIVVCAMVQSPLPLLAWAYLLPAWGAATTVRVGAAGPQLIPALGATGRAELVYAVGLAVGLVLAR
ncbi:MAG: 1,4-dihydroxy-2-naphthoate polyprenyltransferase, partial [Gemmatimonadetes bacterium]|nr:1,4-dihydroxy-2-naphthoate polyprenyltransferase [Gemmatimonadota bacterium]